VTSQLFAQASELAAPAKLFGHPYNGRYHMPLLPGEDGPKSGGDHVSRGCTRMTNIAGAIEDTRALSVWEQAMGLIGLALAPELYEELTLVVAAALGEGVNFERLRDYPALKETLAGHAHDQRKAAESIIGRAKVIAKAGAAAQRGTNRHTAWEHRGKTGQFIGTAEIQEQTVSTEALLADAGLVRVPGLSERVVRNVTLGAVGKFDDILLEQATGRLLISDLKTKATAFYSFLAVDAQLAGYAYAEWMLTEDGQGYEPGPFNHVDLTEGVILHVPSDGSTPRLERADLVLGWRAALLGRDVMALRSAGKSTERMSRSVWVPAPIDYTGKRS
jgi:hypothetical protein